MEPATHKTEVWDGNSHVQGSPSCHWNTNIYLHSTMESRWKLLYFCPPPQTASDQRAEPGEESKARFPFPSAPAQLETKAPFSGTAQTLSALPLLCLRDPGQQGIALIRHPYLLLWRREMVQTSSCYWPPRLHSPGREERSNPHPMQLESIKSLCYSPPSHSPGEKQGVLIISAIQM